MDLRNSMIIKNNDRINDIAKDLAVLNGLLIKKPDLQSVQNAPVTILPSNFPDYHFQYAVRIQKDFNILFNKISRDYKVLHKILERVIVTDDYMRHLWQIYETVEKDGLIQPVFLSLTRNDYMIHVPPECRRFSDDWSKVKGCPGVSLKMIEYNLMASSFAGLAQRLVPMHRLTSHMTGLDFHDNQIPCNNPADGLAKGLLCAWKVYNIDIAVILFVVSSSERNVFDQRVLELAIYEQNPQVIVLRHTFEECLEQGHLDDNKTLWINEQEVAVVYFRHGYVPDHFYSEKIWESKLLLERSRAIKSPSVAQMLVNTKLVQQALCDFSLLRRYVPAHVAQELGETFAGQFLLTDLDKVAEAMANPSEFVLKPQREGGGNNFFEEEMTQQLSRVNGSRTQHEYVLMQRIFPPQFQNLVLPGDSAQVYEEKMVSELGIFGVFLGSATEIHANFQCGHILRSKKFDTNEGGVAAGFGYIDSPFLV